MVNSLHLWISQSNEYVLVVFLFTEEKYNFALKSILSSLILLKLKVVMKEMSRNKQCKIYTLKTMTEGRE